MLQHLQFKHLFFNIDKLQLQIQLLHLSCHCLLLLTVTGRKSKDSAITPETTQTHSHTPLPMEYCRATCSLDAELRMLNEDVTSTPATFWMTINLAWSELANLITSLRPESSTMLTGLQSVATHLAIAVVNLFLSKGLLRRPHSGIVIWRGCCSSGRRQVKHLGVSPGGGNIDLTCSDGS